MLDDTGLEHEEQMGSDTNVYVWRARSQCARDCSIPERWGVPGETPRVHVGAVLLLYQEILEIDRDVGFVGELIQTLVGHEAGQIVFF